VDAHDGDPAAGLHHERRGAGPPLLIIPGASGGSAIFGALADALAGRYTVLTYDRRGHGRSGPDAGFSVAGHAADARAVIEANGFGSATVLGCSAGAIIGLDLAARFPALVSVLVAYEPPLYSVLPHARLRIALRRAELRLRWRRSPAATVFLTREARSVYAWDPGQLAGTRVPLIFGGGRDARNTLPHGIARMLADRLGAQFAEFPGGHRAPMTHPAEFATALTKALAASDAASEGSDGSRLWLD
jgi:pimeloyl-ACP methyl ester carboxylesterase